MHLKVAHKKSGRRDDILLIFAAVVYYAHIIEYLHRFFQWSDGFGDSRFSISENRVFRTWNGGKKWVLRTIIIFDDGTMSGPRYGTAHALEMRLHGAAAPGRGAQWLK